MLRLGDDGVRSWEGDGRDELPGWSWECYMFREEGTSEHGRLLVTLMSRVCQSMVSG